MSDSRTLVIRCSGSHFKCGDETCMCPCHGRSTEPEPIENPERATRPRVERKPGTGMLANRPARVPRAHSDNTQAKYMRGYREGKRITTLPVDEIKARHAAGETIKSIAEGCGYSPGAISKLLGDQAKEIRHLWKEVVLPKNELLEDAKTMTISALSRKYECDRRTIYKALGRGDMRNKPQD